MGPTKIVLPRPDDWHVHFRQGPQMAAYARAHEKSFGRVLVMPNTTPPLIHADAVIAYQNAVQLAAPSLSVIATFRLMPSMGRKDIENLAAAGIRAGKYYPDGATTNSAGGLSDWRQAAEAIAAMEEHNIILCIHGETPSAPVLEREAAFLPTFRAIRQEFPQLKMILEHVSTAEGVHTVCEDAGPSAATVTVQHLLFTLDDLLGGLLSPHLFCKPVVKTEKDRKAIADVVFSGHPRFFFGSDSAPHPTDAKHSPHCPAGAYTAPMIMPALATFFEKAGKLEYLEPFLCQFGRHFYAITPNTGTLTLLKEDYVVPSESEGCVPLMAGQTLPWCIAEIQP